jgi:predicted HTH transcriptional regulator
MYLNSIQFRNLDEKRLIEFLELRIPEGVNIDYKQDVSSSEKGKTYKEFLKDVTAFANASGGDIIIGAKEPSEDLLISDQITGVEKGEEIAQSLERIAAASIDPRVSGFGVKAVLLSTGKYVIVVHIPRL